MSSLALAAPQFYYPAAPASVGYNPYNPSGFYNPAASGFQYVPSVAQQPARVAQPVVAVCNQNSTTFVIFR